MSRRCGWCSSPQRSEWERRVTDGEPIRVVSRDAGFSESAAYRHLRNHVHPELLRELRTADTSLSVSDVAGRLVALLGQSDAVKDYARAVGDCRLLLAACGQERETLGVLMGRLGLDSEETMTTVREGHLLVRAIKAVLVRHPGVLRELAEWLASEPDGESLAESIEWLANTTHAAPRGIPA